MHHSLVHQKGVISHFGLTALLTEIILKSNDVSQNQRGSPVSRYIPQDAGALGERGQNPRTAKIGGRLFPVDGGGFAEPPRDYQAATRSGAGREEDVCRINW